MTEDTPTPQVAAAGFLGGRIRHWLALGTASLLALVLAAAVAGLGWLAWEDQSRSHTVPPGITVDGTPIGGLSVEEAASLIDATFEAPLDLRTITARVATATYDLDVDSFVSVDASGVATDAWALRAGTTLLERLRWRLFDEGVSVDLPVRLQFDDTRLDTWVANLASRIDTPPVDATRTVDPYAGVFVIQEATAGRVLDKSRSRNALRAAMLHGGDVVELPVEMVQPLRTGENLGPAIHVDLSERRLYLWNGDELVKTYGVAIGTAAHPTPRGNWQVVSKRAWPSWGNPGSAWAANMPSYIPPGPSNPLGTRAIYLNASGIRIHGTSQDWSIGSAASHGCMRMHRWDVEDLFDRVLVGTPVFITS